MREIITIHIGQAGLQVGAEFWKMACKEHQLELNGKPTSGEVQKNGYMSAFFDAVGDKYVPRAFLIDLEPLVVDNIVNNQFDNFFDPGNIITGLSGAANNWARGHNTIGNEKLEEAMTKIRQVVDRTESLQGFIITHSIGGGTGSGLGSLLVETLKKEFPKKIIMTFSVFPSPLLSDAVIEPYNSIMTIDRLTEFADQTIVLDNHALYNIAVNQGENPSPTYSDLNAVISNAMSSITASIRYQGSLNTDMREFLVNLVPYPKQHFLITSYAPIIGESGPFSRNTGIGSIIKNLFDDTNAMAACKYDAGVYLATCVLLRGTANAKEFESSVEEVKASMKFAPFIPTGIKTGMTDTPPPGLNTSGVALHNHTAISDVFERIMKQFDTMFERKAFLHWYEAEGLEPNEMKAARDRVESLIGEYRKNAE